MFDFLNTKIFRKGTLQPAFALAQIHVFPLLCAMHAYTFLLRYSFIHTPDHHTTESPSSESFTLQKEENACSKRAGNSSENLNVKVLKPAWEHGYKIARVYSTVCTF